MAHDPLLYRRQFLLTAGACPALQTWPCKRIGSYRLYAHPDVDLTVVTSRRGDTTLGLVGFILDPRYPARSNADILGDLSGHADTPAEIAGQLHTLAGRFVLIVTNARDTFIFHDPCGLRTVCYTEREGSIHVGSQPLILGQAAPLVEGQRFQSYQQSQYKRAHLEDWLPCGCTLYEDVHQLVPNHFLRFSTLRQERYWPTRKLQRRELDETIPAASELLANLLLAARARFDLALSMTAGWDTRLLLAASRPMANDFFYYTLQYRGLDPASRDLRIPAALLGSLDQPHHVINCQGPLDPEFGERYARSTALAHTADWGRIANGIFTGYPAGRVSVKGNGAEICRCYYHHYRNQRPMDSAKAILGLERGWVELDFVRACISNWFAEANAAALAAEVDLLDLTYWEHRMGGWQAQSQLEWDIAQEVFTPFNHRGLIEMMLGVPPEFRCGPRFAMHYRMCEHLWPEVLAQPINPPEFTWNKNAPRPA